MNLHLIDCNSDVVNAWVEAFKRFPEVHVQQGDLLATAEHCVVSPANSYGFMDGGIDAAYRAFFGPQIERAVQDAVTRRPEGHLPVGAGLFVRTGHARVPYLIVAPTMAMPEPVESRNCYRAMKAILRIATANIEVGRNIYCPGLGTGVGMVPPENAAAAMAEAYREWKSATAPTAVSNAGSAGAPPA
ncbi:MAG TPA: macro domain-containing protein [Candidatus Binatia bacterium]|jgi:O-acetyl-ADP-ribose deacetylase (regulator of RNase III)|nr:macro domain-containing protein [Candidatus Binatia bacterium]